MNERLREIYETIMCPDELEGLIQGVTGFYGNPKATWITDGEVANLKIMLTKWRQSRNKPELPR